MSNGTCHGNHDTHVSQIAGDKVYPTKEDLRILMEKEFPGFLENQNIEGPGPVVRWLSGLPELLFAKCWAHYCVQ